MMLVALYCGMVIPEWAFTSFKSLGYLHEQRPLPDLHQAVGIVIKGSNLAQEYKLE